MFILIASLLILFVIIIIFSFPAFSPIPYFPSNKKDIPLIIKALKLRNNQVVYDLGAGGGIVIFAAARATLEKNLNTQFIAVEINPILIAILWTRRLFHPNRKNIKIVQADIFSMNFTPTQPSNHLTIFIYISPWFHQKVIRNIKKQLKKFNVVSYYYPVLKENEGKKTIGVHLVYYLTFDPA